MFVTFEGIEGTGKSTQIGLLAQELTRRGQRVAVTREPGGSLVGRELRRILLSLETKNLCDRAELFLYLADRAQHVAEVVRPALAQGMVVLCDRFTDSTVAYQGYGRGLDPALLRTLNDTATGSLVPDLTILLDLDPEIGLRRALSRNLRAGAQVDEGRFEAESLAFHSRVRQGYLAIAATARERFRIVTAAIPPEEVFTRVLAACLEPRP
ncbi:dTMP kinase [Desulfolutivibrio sulfoxidireducens]|uniref:dTMP kinase n=1 Tax=Desulfolutivibrio sulfoxidireducens TaxID=2773299 RepID=UPI00159E4960|nr:dTMP kinase [Desulfolutivibrio sulfoxidireducens]QLA18850.1 dTMP kinase [Desulfolutivibrio sulfoxidireducens]